MVATGFVPPAAGFQLVLLTAEVDFVSRKAVRGPDVEIDAQDLSGHLQARFVGQVRPPLPPFCSAIRLPQLGRTCMLPSFRLPQDAHPVL